MIKLSDRLQSIAEEINTKTMADIGTDHGFLPLYLYENSICDKVIMTDVSKGSLLKCEENCKKYYPQKIFDLRLGSGLDVISPKEVEIVVMAGIGAVLTASLLAKDIEKSKGFTLILQPRRHEEKLRQWLDENGFEILKDKLVKERNLYCQVMVVRYNPSYKPLHYDYMFPDSIKDSPLKDEYLDYWMIKCKRNLNSAKKGSNTLDILKWEGYIKRIEELRNEA
ncbi:MAG: class I SAM-dependent methyltransferase [Clostridia bacterium]|nr:class I SAM-dependent methyltransferase [Clostridia bacterium]